MEPSKPGDGGDSAGISSVWNVSSEVCIRLYTGCLKQEAGLDSL